MSARVALVWAPQEVRTEMFARELGAEVLHVHYLRYKRPMYAPVKYVIQAVVTLYKLFRLRPAAVYVTNPPPFAALVTALYCRLKGSRYVMDTHPPALFSRKWSWSVPLQRWAARRADLNIIDQERYRKLLESWGARACVVERPPRQVHADRRPANREPIVSVVNTFAVDEPLAPVLDAAAKLPDIAFHVLGDVTRGPSALIGKAPPNVTFVGYLRHEEYWNEIGGADVVVALTTYPHSLLAAGQDAMAVGRPLVTSDKPVLREYFGDAALYVSDDGADLARGIGTALRDGDVLAARMQCRRSERLDEWLRAFSEVRAAFERAERAAAPR